MGVGLEIVAGQATAPGATLTALTPIGGTTFTVRNSAGDAPNYLLSTWAFSQAAGILRIRSPRMHDNVQGIRFRTGVNDPEPRYLSGFKQRLYPQDPLTVELSGSAVAGDIEQAAMLMYYSDIPGVAARLWSPADVMAKTLNLVTVEHVITPLTTGGFSGERAFNADFNLLRSDELYAIIGYEVSSTVLAVRYRGVDFGNLGVGGPGSIGDRFVGLDWFARLSNETGLPLVPVFDSSNAPGILVDIATNELAPITQVVTYLAHLGPKGS